MFRKRGLDDPGAIERRQLWQRQGRRTGRSVHREGRLRGSRFLRSGDPRRPFSRPGCPLSIGRVRSRWGRGRASSRWTLRPEEGGRSGGDRSPEHGRQREPQGGRPRPWAPVGAARGGAGAGSRRDGQRFCHGHVHDDAPDGGWNCIRKSFRDVRSAGPLSRPTSDAAPSWCNPPSTAGWNWAVAAKNHNTAVNGRRGPMPTDQMNAADLPPGGGLRPPGTTQSA